MGEAPSLASSADVRGCTRGALCRVWAGLLACGEAGVTRTARGLCVSGRGKGSKEIVEEEEEEEEGLFKANTVNEEGPKRDRATRRWRKRRRWWWRRKAD